MGEGGFRCSLNLSPKVLEDSPIYFFITIHPVTLVSVNDSTLLQDWIFVFGRHQEVLDGGASFTVHLYPKLLANVLNGLTKSTVVWDHYVGLRLVVHLGFVGWLLSCFFVFICILLRAQVGYLRFLSAFLRCSSSFCSSCGLEQMVCALCCSVSIMLYFDVKSVVTVPLQGVFLLMGKNTVKNGRLSKS